MAIKNIVWATTTESGHLDANMAEIIGPVSTNTINKIGLLPPGVAYLQEKKPTFGEALEVVSFHRSMDFLEARSDSYMSLLELSIDKLPNITPQHQLSSYESHMLLRYDAESLDQLLNGWVLASKSYKNFTANLYGNGTIVLSNSRNSITFDLHLKDSSCSCKCSARHQDKLSKYYNEGTISHGDVESMLRSLSEIWRFYAATTSSILSAQAPV